VPNGRELRRIPAERVDRIYFDPAGSRLATITDDGRIALWDVADGARIGEVRVRPLDETTARDVGAQTQLAWEPSGTALWTATVGGTVLRWDLDPGRWVRSACVAAGRSLTADEWDQVIGSSPPGGLRLRSLAAGGRSERGAPHVQSRAEQARLGTLVDEPGGLHRSIRELVPSGPIDDLVELWLSHVDEQQKGMLDGRRTYASGDVVDREAAQLVADRCGLTDPAAVDRLATAERRLEPWPDTRAGLDRLARRFPVVGLSNASRATLTRLSAHAGLRWHHLLSAEDARGYKPAPEVYRLEVDLAGGASERVLLVVAQAWDLRGAQAVGLRTTYVRRPVGDPPRATDAFGHHAADLADLVAALLDDQPA
jgi:2-haloacid dehalogenase